MLGLRLVDKVVVNKPLHGTTLGAGVTKGVPGLQEIRTLLMEFVLEPSEGATPPDRAGQSPARPVVTDPVCEVSHVLVPHIGRQRVDADQVDIVQINEPWGPFPTGAVFICSPDCMTFRWVKSEDELWQLQQTFPRRGWTFPNPIPPIPSSWLAQYGELIGATP